MSHRKLHWLEKAQVELATAAALAVVFFLIAPHLRPWDPAGPLTYIPYDAWRGLALFALTVWGLSVACGLLTVTSRPEGAIVAVFLGAGGFAAQSPQMEGLLWAQADGFTGMFHSIMLEMVVLIGVLLVAVLIVGLMRSLVRAVQPKWLWQGNAEDMDRSAAQPASRPSWVHVALWGSESSGGVLTRQAIQRSIGCLGLSLMLGLALLLVLLRSNDRGQIIFAVFTSCLVALLIAHQVLTCPLSIVAWLMPMILGLAIYLLSSISPIGGEVTDWTKVSLLARALPVDWMTAGAGGGVLGYWISERIHEARHIEKQQQQKET